MLIQFKKFFKTNIKPITTKPKTTIGQAKRRLFWIYILKGEILSKEKFKSTYYFLKEQHETFAQHLFKRNFGIYRKNQTSHLHP